MKIPVCDISGMGGREDHGYEWGCQVICLRALHFMEQLKRVPKYSEFKNTIGILSPEEPAAKELDDYIHAHPLLKEYGMTGAMHQYGIHHAMRIFSMGREAYLAELRKHRNAPHDFFEFEEDDAFPPEAPRLAPISA